MRQDFSLSLLSSFGDLLVCHSVELGNKCGLIEGGSLAHSGNDIRGGLGYRGVVRDHKIEERCVLIKAEIIGDVLLLSLCELGVY